MRRLPLHLVYDVQADGPSSWLLDSDPAAPHQVATLVVEDLERALQELKAFLRMGLDGLVLELRIGPDDALVRLVGGTVEAGVVVYLVGEVAAHAAVVRRGLEEGGLQAATGAAFLAQAPAGTLVLQLADWRGEKREPVTLVPAAV